MALLVLLATVCAAQALRLDVAVSARDRGESDCTQDYYENSPFACVGGLGARTNMRKPDWLPEHDWEEYRDGYQTAAHQLFGPEWRTCSFGWRPALTINEPPAPCPECGAYAGEACSVHCPTRGRDGLNPNDDP